VCSFYPQNDEFHQIIEELVVWLEKTENIIRQAEPVDLTDELEVIEAKYNKFRVSGFVRIFHKAAFICICLNTCTCHYLKYYRFFPVYCKDILKLPFLFEAVSLTLVIMLTGTEKRFGTM
jgi:hypothetical protein